MRDEDGAWLGSNSQGLQGTAEVGGEGAESRGSRSSWMQKDSSGAVLGQIGDWEAWEDAVGSRWEGTRPEPGPWGQKSCQREESSGPSRLWERGMRGVKKVPRGLALGPREQWATCNRWGSGRRSATSYLLEFQGCDRPGDIMGGGLGTREMASGVTGLS